MRVEKKDQDNFLNTISTIKCPAARTGRISSPYVCLYSVTVCELTRLRRASLATNKVQSQMGVVERDSRLQQHQEHSFIFQLVGFHPGITIFFPSSSCLFILRALVISVLGTWPWPWLEDARDGAHIIVKRITLGDSYIPFSSSDKSPWKQFNFRFEWFYWKI